MSLPRGTRRLIEKARSSNKGTRSLISQASSSADVREVRRLCVALDAALKSLLRESKQMRLREAA